MTVGEKEYIYCYDQTMTLIGIIDQYESLIWTDRYNDCGEFELYFPFDLTTLTKCQQDYYLMLPAFSEHTMVVETITVETTVDKGTMCTVTGRSVECLLKRRAPYEDESIVGPNDVSAERFTYNIRWLIDKNMGVDASDSRKIPEIGYIEEDQKSDVIIGNMKYQYDRNEVYESLYSMIQDACESLGIGFKMIWTGVSPLRTKITSDNYTEDTGGVFALNLYARRNRVLTASEVEQYIYLSAEDDIIYDISTCLSKTEYRNYCILIGFNGLAKSGDETNTKFQGEAYSTESEPTGLARLEVYLDASNEMSPEYDSSGNAILSDDYKEKIRQNAQTKIKNKDYSATSVVNASIDSNKVDLQIGDLIAFEDIYGPRTYRQLTEMSYQISSSGVDMSYSFVDGKTYLSGDINISGSYGGTNFLKYFSIENVSYGLVDWNTSLFDLVPQNMPMKEVEYTSLYTVTSDYDNYIVDSTCSVKWIAKKKCVLWLKIICNYVVSSELSEGWGYDLIDVSRRESSPNEVIIYKNDAKVTTLNSNRNYGATVSGFEDYFYKRVEVALDAGDYAKIEFVCHTKSQYEWMGIWGYGVQLYF